MVDPIHKVRICHATLSGRIVIARFGKDPRTALSTKDATSDFWQTLASFAFDGQMPEPGQAAEISFGGGDEQFEIIIKRKVTP